jgi:hypothetical protein
VTEIGIVGIIALLMAVSFFCGWGVAKDQECYAVCKRENELRRQYANIARACGYSGMDAHPDLTECVCR